MPFELLNRFRPDRDLRVTTSDGVGVAVQDWGGSVGRDILFIHGFSQASICWYHQVTGSLRGRHRLVSYDLRGHGGSDKPTDPQAYRDPALWAGEVHTVIEALGLVRPVIVAWSYAGRIALDYVLRFGSEQISGLVMVAATSNSAPSMMGPGASLIADMCNAQNLHQNLASTSAFLCRCTARTFERDDHALLLASNMVVPVPIRAAMYERTADYEAVLRTLSVPLLAIHGALDQIRPPAISLHTQSLVPRGSVLVYDGIGHMPFWEAPQRFDDDLASFVQQTAP